MRGIAVVVAAGLLGAVAAQERRPAFVVAQDAHGRPVPGATITCVASPAFTESSDEVDLVEGVTDDRGRVVAKLLTHRTYSAHAILPGDAGHFLASEMQENVAAGGDVVLAVVVQRRPQRIVVEGEAGWRGPLTVAIAPEAQNRLLLTVQDGRVPRLPGIAGVLVRDAQGQPLWSHAVLSRPLWHQPDEPAEALRDTLVVDAGMRHDTTDAEGCLHYLMLPLPEARLRFGGGEPDPHMGGAAKPGGIVPGTRTDLVVK